MQPGVRLAEVVGSLSLATGLCTGQPIEHGLRRSLLAVWLGEELGLGAAELSETNRRVWAALPGDGIVLDTERAVWTPGWTETGPACLRVAEGGELLDTVPLDRAGFACTLGGEDGRILFVLAAGLANAGRLRGQHHAPDDRTGDGPGPHRRGPGRPHRPPLNHRHGRAGLAGGDVNEGRQRANPRLTRSREP
jgi:hypothetical protein